MPMYLLTFPSAAMNVADEEIAQVDRDAHNVMRQAKETGVYVFAGGIDESVSPRLVSGDGSWKEGGHPTPMTGGVAILNVDSRDEAMLWAAKFAKACRAEQELRVFGLDPES